LIANVAMNLKIIQILFSILINFFTHSPFSLGVCAFDNLLYACGGK
jgi:hypothetical protein